MTQPIEYSVIMDELVENKDYYKTWLKSVNESQYAGVEDLVRVNVKSKKDQAVVFALASVFTVKYDYDMEELVVMLEQVDWIRYLES